MHVKNVMTHCAVTMPKDSTLAEVTRVLLKHHLNGVPIVDSENKLLGIITRADIFRRILPGYDEICREGTNLDFAQIEERANQAAQLKVDEAMSCPVITVDEETPVIKAGSLMLLKGIKQFPVVRSGKIIGMVTLTDVIEELMLWRRQ